MAAHLPKPMLEAQTLDAIPLLTDEALFEKCGVRIAFTSRAGGVSKPPLDALNLGINVPDEPACLAENRKRVLGALGVPDMPLVVPKQVHGTEVLQVQGPDDVARALAVAAQGIDAVVGAAPGVAVQLGFADCLPLIIVSPSGRFAVAHAGWRGAVAGIAGIAVRALAEADAQAGEETLPAQYNAYIGPYIHAECFETGAEVTNAFVERFGSDVLLDGRVSLVAAVTIDMQKAGVDIARIADAGICTKCNPETYFSYRATDGACGRQAALAFTLERN